GVGNRFWLPCSDGPRIVDVAESATERELGRYVPTTLPGLGGESNDHRAPAVFVGDTFWTAEDKPVTGGAARPGPTGVGGWHFPYSGEAMLVGQWSARWPVEVMATDGRYLYLVGNTWGDISVVDVREPGHPVEVAHLERGPARAACPGGDGMHPCPYQS